MMKLNLSVPSTLDGYAVNQRSIPCHCLVGREGFKLIFSKPVFDAVGVVDEWDEKKFDTAAPALAGGEYTHDEFATVTLKLLEEGVFEVVELDVFSRVVGWISVIKDSQYREIDV